MLEVAIAALEASLDRRAALAPSPR